MAGEKIRKIFRRPGATGGADALGASRGAGMEKGGKAVVDDSHGIHGGREREHGRGDAML